MPCILLILRAVGHILRICGTNPTSHLLQSKHHPNFGCGWTSLKLNPKALSMPQVAGYTELEQGDVSNRGAGWASHRIMTAIQPASAPVCLVFLYSGEGRFETLITDFLMQRRGCMPRRVIMMDQTLSAGSPVVRLWQQRSRTLGISFRWYDNMSSLSQHIARETTGLYIVPVAVHPQESFGSGPMPRMLNQNLWDAHVHVRLAMQKVMFYLALRSIYSTLLQAAEKGLCAPCQYNIWSTEQAVYPRVEERRLSELHDKAAAELQKQRGQLVAWTSYMTERRLPFE